METKENITCRAVNCRKGRILGKPFLAKYLLWWPCKSQGCLWAHRGYLVTRDCNRACVPWPQLASWWHHEAGFSPKGFQEEPNYCETCRSHSLLLSSRKRQGKTCKELNQDTEAELQNHWSEWIISSLVMFWVKLKQLFKQMPCLRGSHTSFSWGFYKCLFLFLFSFIFHSRPLTVEFWVRPCSVGEKAFICEWPWGGSWLQDLWYWKRRLPSLLLLLHLCFLLLSSLFPLSPLLFYFSCFEALLPL